MVEGADLMSKFGVNVPKGVVVSSTSEIAKVLEEHFPDDTELVVNSQVLAGGRGLGTFKSGLKGGVHTVPKDNVEEIAGKWLGEDTEQNARFMDVPFRGVPAGFGVSLNSMRCQHVLTAIAESKGYESKELAGAFMAFYHAIFAVEPNSKVDVADSCFLLKGCLSAGFTEAEAEQYLRASEDAVIKQRLKSFQSDIHSFVDENIQELLTLLDPVAEAYRRRIFFNYERRLRLRSPPEKVFAYFASVRRGEVSFMTVGDLMRAILPVFPPSGSHLVREGHLGGERSPGELKFFMLFDTNGDGLISIPEHVSSTW